MSRFKSGTTVTYSQSYGDAATRQQNQQLIGQVDRVIPTRPALIYVHWNDGSYNAISELHLEAL